MRQEHVRHARDDEAHEELLRQEQARRSGEVLCDTSTGPSTPPMSLNIPRVEHDVSLSCKPGTALCHEAKRYLLHEVYGLQAPLVVVHVKDISSFAFHLCEGIFCFRVRSCLKFSLRAFLGH